MFISPILSTLDRGLNKTSPQSFVLLDLLTPDGVCKNFHLHEVRAPGGKQCIMCTGLDCRS